MIFPLQATASGPILDTPAFLTDVLESSNQTEQRVKLRGTPRRAIEFSIVCANERAAATAVNLLRGAQATAIGVPFWQYASPLTAAAGIGAIALSVDTTGVPWRAGSSVMIWSSPWDYELVTLSSAGVGVLNVSATSLAWGVGALAVPIGDAHFDPDPSFSLASLTAGTARLRFLYDPTAPAITDAAAWSAPTYAGLSILEGDKLNRPGALDEGYPHKLTVLDSVTGARQVDALAVAPRTGKTVHWRARGRTDIAVVRAFLESRKGRLLPFWAPSLQSDFRLTADLAPAATSLVVQWVGYTETVWPLGRAGRHLALHLPGSGWEYRKVTAAAHTPGAATETLTIDTGVGHGYTAALATVMYLKCCRLDSDEAGIAWRNGQLADAEIPLRELPLEEPL